MKSKAKASTVSARAGWRINEWCGQLGICRSTLYNMVGRGEIELVRVGGISVITTDPVAFLAAKAAEQRVPAPPE
jgi:predicted site-specific integrase-resolvase